MEQGDFEKLGSLNHIFDVLERVGSVRPNYHEMRTMKDLYRSLLNMNVNEHCTPCLIEMIHSLKNVYHIEIKLRKAADTKTEKKKDK